MKRQWGIRSFALAIGLTLMMSVACDKKKDDDETEETKDKTEEEEPEESETSDETEESASAEAEEPKVRPPVKTAKPVPVGACRAQGQCNGGLCCASGAKTFCAEPNKPCGGGRVVCARDSQCGRKNACLPEAAIPGIKTCQKRTAAAAPKPKPKPAPAGDVAPFRPKK